MIRAHPSIRRNLSVNRRLWRRQVDISRRVVRASYCRIWRGAGRYLRNRILVAEVRVPLLPHAVIRPSMRFCDGNWPYREFPRNLGTAVAELISLMLGAEATGRSHRWRLLTSVDLNFALRPRNRITTAQLLLPRSGPIVRLVRGWCALSIMRAGAIRY